MDPVAVSILKFSNVIFLTVFIVLVFLALAVVILTSGDNIKEWRKEK